MSLCRRYMPHDDCALPALFDERSHRRLPARPAAPEMETTMDRSSSQQKEVVVLDGCRPTRGGASWRFDDLDRRLVAGLFVGR